MAKAKLSPADEKWGYVAGCDGWITIAEAAELLNCSIYTVRRLWAAGKIRRSKVSWNFVRYCRRSVSELHAQSEVAADA